MPQHDLATLMTFNSALTFAGILMAMICVWVVVRQAAHNARDLSQDVREIAQMHCEVAFMIRRQYGDIDRDLQEIKEMLGGQ